MRKLVFATLVSGIVGLSFSQMDSVESMKAMAMENMKRFMNMPSEKRKEYVKKKEEEAYERGRELYNAYGCSGCHPGGGNVSGKVMGMPIPSLKGVKERFPKFKAGNDQVITLSDMVNNCIVMFANKKPLPFASRDMRALTYFVSKLK